MIPKDFKLEIPVVLPDEVAQICLLDTGNMYEEFSIDTRMSTKIPELDLQFCSTDENANKLFYPRWRLLHNVLFDQTWSVSVRLGEGALQLTGTYSYSLCVIIC